ncbi:hypothetical protein LYSIN_01701 [Lysinibacillus sphaericus]|uniref:Uncharacterized protein n=1 Tax=Lysinibacillus sphaericus TaxID=1421 RepID=A0A2S5D1Q1_LYSSH|nr:hypothetical protein LYSIN_01701 [Lysinibacillus sphaericus]
MAISVVLMAISDILVAILLILAAKNTTRASKLDALVITFMQLLLT